MGLLRTSISLAVLTGLIGCSASGGTTPRSTTPRPDPDLITAAEISAQSFRDGYHVVQQLRPTWFTRKSGGSTSRRIGTSPSSSTTGSGIVVYLNNARMGGVDALRQLSANSIESLRFLDAAMATATLPGIGSSVVSGAIVVRLQGGA